MSVSTSPTPVRENTSPRLTIWAAIWQLIGLTYFWLHSARWVASGGSPIHRWGAVCSDQHAEFHSLGLHPASTRVSRYPADLHWKDDWWHDEVFSRVKSSSNWFMQINSIFRSTFQCSLFEMLLFLFRFMFILVIIGTAFLCGINNVYVPFMISPNLGRYFPANIKEMSLLNVRLTFWKEKFHFKNVQLKCLRFYEAHY